MTAPRLRNRRQIRGKSSGPNWARITLWFFVFWPLFAYVFLSNGSGNTSSPKEKLSQLRGQVRSLLSRHEVEGYGPSHPRFAFVVTGSSPDAVTRSVESIYRYTDRNRILAVVVVFDGISSDPSLMTRLEGLDRGDAIPHFHGIHFHAPHFQSKPEIDLQHSTKLHVVFHPEKRGVSLCRRAGATFAKILAQKQQESGLKRAEEEILLVLVRQDAALVSDKWIDAVTAGLIVPRESKTLANAVAFAVDYVDRPGGGYNDTDSQPFVRAVGGAVASFDLDFHPKWNVDRSYIAQHHSYPTPALPGAVTAMRLNTYFDLPAQDPELDTHFAADVELSLNLWLCGDGIDILPAARVTIDPSKLNPTQSQLTDRHAARIASTWMEPDYTDAVFRARTSKTPSRKSKMTQWAREAKADLDANDIPTDLPSRCRSLAWYAKEINSDFKLKKTGVVKLKAKRDDSSLKTDPKNRYEPKIPEPHVPQNLAPGRKLSPAKLEILSHAQPVDLEYVDVNDGQHPHFGAYDENDRLGYVHDATALKKQPPQFEFDKEAVCSIRDANYRMLTEKVFVDLKGHEEVEKRGTERVKLFCVVYTTEKSHFKIPPIRQTWGNKCDGFMVASTKTDPSLSTVNIAHEGEEDYQNIWQKVRSIWSYVYDNYYEDYDFFHIGGDDLYLLVENLRLYLESEEIRLAAAGGKIGGVPEGREKPLFLGRRFAEQGNLNRIFNSGGAGYTINKAALKSLVVEAFPKTFPHLKTFAEDVMVATCFRKMGVFPFETRDENGSERYMPFQPGHHLNYRPPPNPEKDWYAKYMAFGLKTGLDHCAERSVAFHYIKPELMKRMHAILYGFCKET